MQPNSLKVLSEPSETAWATGAGESVGLGYVSGGVRAVVPAFRSVSEQWFVRDREVDDLRHKVNALQQQVATLQKFLEKVHSDVARQEMEAPIFRRVTLTEARKLVTAYILRMKANGTTRISGVDLVRELRLPPPQIERVMTDFSRERKVKEAI